MKIAGYTCRNEVLVAALIIGALLCTHLAAGCVRKNAVKKKIREGMDVLGANLGYSMSRGVPGSYGRGSLGPYRQNLSQNRGPRVPLPPGELFFFANNKFTPECCVPPFSNVSSADGCACVTKEQVDYINARGGNRVPNSYF